MNSTNEMPRLALQPGVYELVQDVTNPHPDRRRTRDWRAETVWKKGTRFVVTESHMCPGRIELHLLGGWLSNSIMDTPRAEHEGGEQARAIIAQLRREPETLGTFKTMDDSFDADDVLAALIDAGRITLDEIKAVHAKLRERSDVSYSDVASPERTDARVAIDMFHTRHGLHGNKIRGR